MDEEEEEVED